MAGKAGGRGRKAPQTKIPITDVPLPADLNKSLQQIVQRIPEQLLSSFQTENGRDLYIAILSKLVEEALPEGSTILQSLVAERAAYYWAKGHEKESGEKGLVVNEEYKFYVYEFNRNLEILRGLALRNLPAQQVRLLAKKTIAVIDRIVKNPGEKDIIIKEIVQEFSIEVPVVGFGKASVQLGDLLHA